LAGRTLPSLFQMEDPRMGYEDLFKELQEVAEAVKKMVQTIQDASEDGKIKLREAVEIARAAAAIIKEIGDVLAILQPVIYAEVATLPPQSDAQ